MRSLLLTFIILFSFFPANRAAAFPRFPATNDTEIVFSHAGQLHTVPAAGGIARRLTNSPGSAIFPRFSADGKLLAFTAQYDGNTEVYVMPAAGGEPRRLTFSATPRGDDLSSNMGPHNIVMAWRNTADEITYRSRARSWNSFIGQLMSVGLDGGLPAQLPVPRGGFVSYSPDDTKIAYNRVFREFRPWKNYRGGMADDIWIYDLKTGAIENITNHPAQDYIPMWAPDNRIYFVSERAGRANLFVYDIATKQTRQLTHHADYDVKFPSIGKKSLVYEQAGLIWRLDLATEKTAPVPVTVSEDLVTARPSITKIPPEKIASIRPSPDGQRVVVTAHGDIFTVPLKNGPTRNLTQTPGVHERDASWSPDGRFIACLSDASGEFEIHIRPGDDPAAEPVRLTTGADSYFLAPIWSPDSKKLLWADRAQRLRYVDVETKAVTLVAENPDAPIRQYAWSPDSALIAWACSSPGKLQRIKIHNTADQTTTDATDDWYSSGSPVFSDDGKWLLFVSARDFNPTYSDAEWNHAYLNRERIYMVALSKKTKSPLDPRSDEVRKLGKKKTATNADNRTARPNQETAAATGTTAAASPHAGESRPESRPAENQKPKVETQFDPDGLSARIVALPVEASNYRNIRAIDGRVFYQRGSTIASFDLKDNLKETIHGSYRSFEITADGKKMLVRDNTGYAIIALPKAKIEITSRLNLSDLQLLIDPRAEWAQIFHESWRQMRDCFYAPNMHGIDWPAQRDKYAKLLPLVTTRNDLTHLIGEMVGELHASHTYVSASGASAPRIPVGQIGAELARDDATGYFQITKILREENRADAARSPIARLGVNAREGDYILAIDGKSTRDMTNPYAALVGAVGRQVTLRLAPSPDAAAPGARDIVIVPVASEAQLYYADWVRRNIDTVARKTGGRAGYLHIPNMKTDGLNEFMRRFYPQLGKEALIIDVRGNGGGNVSPMIIERLRRELAYINLRRGGSPANDPAHMHLGPKVTLMDEYSASDGDLFAYRFREMGLGKLIGRRSWGGAISIYASLPFMDGGSLSVPERGHYSKDGKEWIIEGRGVEPDIEVDNDPAREFRGEDQQLDRAIEEILAALQTNNPKIPPPPPWPVK